MKKYEPFNPHRNYYSILKVVNKAIPKLKMVKKLA